MKMPPPRQRAWHPSSGSDQSAGAQGPGAAGRTRGEVLKNRDVATWMLTACGAWLVILGIYFSLLRPPLLPEDLQFMGTTASEGNRIGDRSFRRPHRRNDERHELRPALGLPMAAGDACPDLVCRSQCISLEGAIRWPEAPIRPLIGLPMPFHVESSRFIGGGRLEDSPFGQGSRYRVEGRRGVPRLLVIGSYTMGFAISHQGCTSSMATDAEAHFS
jgi:hypothetical protein